ncbi:hypothetical protein E3N88_09395 [Mikania micrantha]|uniref:Uncharacterized protein n=1 Tax=Mikania micrantha TaxID=192012 RepID=A0A5N6PIX1_9ASTR|nr:hypothetical protein E3N88_09395 [Mikania micrantha]
MVQVQTLNTDSVGSILMVWVRVKSGLFTGHGYGQNWSWFRLQNMCLSMSLVLVELVSKMENGRGGDRVLGKQTWKKLWLKKCMSPETARRSISSREIGFLAGSKFRSVHHKRSSRYKGRAGQKLYSGEDPDKLQTRKLKRDGGSTWTAAVRENQQEQVDSKKARKNGSNQASKFCKRKKQEQEQETGRIFVNRSSKGQEPMWSFKAGSK